MGERKMVSVPVEVAETINRVFLPRNPRKMRGAHQDVLAAVLAFKKALADTQGGYAP